MKMPDLSWREVQLYHRQDGRCYYCDGEIRLPMTGEHKIGLSKRIGTEEHIQPRCLGGTNHAFNRVIACAWCNCGWAHLVDQWALKTFGGDR